MKTWVKVIIIIVICAILLVPIPAVYKDGGTVEYNAILYTVRKVHSLAPFGYNIGTQVRIFFWIVYDDVEYVRDAQ